MKQCRLFHIIVSLVFVYSQFCIFFISIWIDERSKPILTFFAFFILIYFWIWWIFFHSLCFSLSYLNLFDQNCFTIDCETVLMNIFIYTMQYIFIDRWNSNGKTTFENETCLFTKRHIRNELLYKMPVGRVPKIMA